MTLEEAQAIAREVVANKSRSYVADARTLAEYVLSIRVPKIHGPECAIMTDAGEPGSAGLGCTCGVDEG